MKQLNWKGLFAALVKNPHAVGLFAVALLNQLVGVGALEAISPETLEHLADLINLIISAVLYIAALLMVSPRQKKDQEL